MKRFLWRKIIYPVLSFLLVLIILLILRPPSGKTDQGTTEIPKEQLRLILENSELQNMKRIKLIEDVCKKYNLGIYKSSIDVSIFKYPPTPQYSVFYFDSEHNVAYCPVYKAGSTTWLYNLLKLNGVTDNKIEGKQMSEVAREIFPELDGDSAESKFPDCKRLLCVRHPFDRILSAYRDKLEDRHRAPQHGTLHYYKRWGSRIRKKYREEGQLEPTFEEFVRYLIDTDLLLYADDHWIPYNAYCTPCLVRYDFVAKVETLTEDQLFFIHKLRLDSLTPSRRHSSAKISSQVASSYFSRVTKAQVQKLYEKFKLDFEMFNYSINPFLNYAKD